MCCIFYAFIAYVINVLVVIFNTMPRDLGRVYPINWQIFVNYLGSVLYD